MKSAKIFLSQTEMQILCHFSLLTKDDTKRGPFGLYDIIKGRQFLETAGHTMLVSALEMTAVTSYHAPS